MVLRSRRLLVAVLGSALFLGSAHAFADPSAANKETARALMEDGDKKLEAGDLKGALASYTAGDAIMKVPTTGLEVAKTQARLGLLIEARETARNAAAIPARPGEFPIFSQARKSAEAMVADLGNRIPAITVAITGGDASEAKITIDGEAIAAAAASQPRKVNPGKHTVVARIGSVERGTTVDAVERETRTATLDFGGDAAAPAAPAPPAPPASSGTGAKILMIGGFAVGAVGLGVGAVTGLITISKTSDLKNDCPDTKCKPGRENDIASANSMGNVSTVAFIVGGVGVVAGVIGYFLIPDSSSGSGKERAASRPIQSLRANAGPSYVGLSGTF